MLHRALDSRTKNRILLYGTSEPGLFRNLRDVCD